jgi:DNA repair photolyase
MATGSYEGSLSIEGIPARNGRRLFTETAYTVSLAISTSSDPFQPVKTRARGQDEEAGNIGEAR